LVGSCKPESAAYAAALPAGLREINQKRRTRADKIPYHTCDWRVDLDIDQGKRPGIRAILRAALRIRRLDSKQGGPSR
jgi:hypothetical protein